MKTKEKGHATLPAFEALEDRVLMAADFAGNTFAAARDIGTPHAVVYNDYVGADDTKDFYKFQVTEPSLVRLWVGNMTANADLTLYNNAGVALNDSQETGHKPELIYRELRPGTYYASINRKWGNTNYTFRPNVAPDPGAGRFNSRDLGTINGVKVVNGRVSGYDRYDTYKFRVDSRSKVNMRLYNLKNNADLELLNAAGQRMTLASKPGTAPEFISRNLNAGTYYVRVRRRVGATTYKMSLAAWSLDPDGSMARATDLGVLLPGFPRILGDSVSAADRNDYYRITIPWWQTLDIRLTGLTSDADVRLLDNGGTTLAASTKGGTQNESITRIVTPGIYYIKVNSFSGVHTNYGLSVWVT